MRKMHFVFAVMFSLISCNSKSPVSDSIQTDTFKSFFPVTDYLLAQTSELMNAPVTPLKITTHNGKTDSVWMNQEQTKIFVQNFLSPAIDSVKLYNLFNEISFLDQTINAFTLTYDPVKKLSDTSILRRWDVYIDADLKTVKRIYIEKLLRGKEGADLLQKLTWRTGQYCKITTINESDTSLQHVKEEQLIWNFDE